MSIKRFGAKRIRRVIIIFASTGVIILGGFILALVIRGNKAGLTFEQAKRRINSAYKHIAPRELPEVIGAIDTADFSVTTALLDIDEEYPLLVRGRDGDVTVEIFASVEKATMDDEYNFQNDWLLDMAKAFNEERYFIEGTPVSIAVRGIESGVAVDYITTGIYTPDAFSPANELWGQMVMADGIKAELLEKRLAGNVAGILIERRKYNEFLNKYGEVNLATINHAVQDGAFNMGYTNPLASSTAANYLLSLLYSYSPNDPLSEQAELEFIAFQSRVPFVAYTTLQMRASAERGALDGFVFESQQFAITPELRSRFVFTPFGVRHDNPIYAIGDIGPIKRGALEAFIALCLSNEGQEAASAAGFNSMDDYVCDMEIDGAYLNEALKLYKERKGGGRDIAVVFVADIGAAMGNDDRMNNLKLSLLDCSKRIDQRNFVGLVRYNERVEIAMPIGRFDDAQRGRLIGAVGAFAPSGKQAMYDAIITAEKMLLDYMANGDGNGIYAIIALTSGGSDSGYTYGACAPWFEATGIQIYTADYMGEANTLSILSAQNSASINESDSPDIMFDLRSLFSADM